MRILSGLQPTGRLHIGNYFGMMEPAIQLQDEGDAFYFIADYHSLTAIQDPKVLRENVFDLAVDFLACGLDPDKATFFRQSDVPEVTELTWILSTVTPKGLMERGHSYKDKKEKGIEASLGLFSYPVLMASDILIYDSDVVPVGKDQKQHLEFTRDIAAKLNHAYGGEILKLPAERIRANEAAAAVPGLDGQKMSKSYGNILPIFEDEKPFRKKIMGIVTDSSPVEAPKPTEGSVILQLYRLVSDDADYNQMVSDFEAGGCGYGDFKKRLFEALWEHFAPMRIRRSELLVNRGDVEDVLRDGATRARGVAQGVLERVRAAVGL